MSFPGYGVILFDPRKDLLDKGEIPSYYTSEYFANHLTKGWNGASIEYIAENSYFAWTIPNLASVEGDNLFMGRFHEEENNVYFLEIAEFKVLEIHSETKLEDISNFLGFTYD